jgi:aldose 1-epimerase
MERFSAETTRTPERPGEVVVLRDNQAGSWARVLPEGGCDLVSFGAPVAGRRVEAFLQPADETRAYPVGSYGAPVLFPFPNRLRGGHAEFEGKTIQIDLQPGQVNAIHGLVRHRPWRVDRLAGESDAAVARCSIESDADILRQFPFPFRLTLTFRLTGARLRVEVEAENRGDSAMPMGFGWHPYFRLPFLPGTERGADEIQVPADRLWVLDSELLPTGETVPVPPEKDFQRLRAIDGEHLDDVYTDVHRVNGESSCRLVDPSTGITLRVSAGPSFREWVVFAPPHRPTICFEPYTCPTDAFNLAARGLDVGVIVLQAGQAWQDWMELELT